MFENLTQSTNIFLVAGENQQTLRKIIHITLEALKYFTMNPQFWYITLLFRTHYLAFCGMRAAPKAKKATFNELTE